MTCKSVVIRGHPVCSRQRASASGARRRKAETTEDGRKNEGHGRRGESWGETEKKTEKRSERQDATRHARSVNGYAAHTINRVASSRIVRRAGSFSVGGIFIRDCATGRSLPAANRYVRQPSSNRQCWALDVIRGVSSFLRTNWSGSFPRTRKRVVSALRVPLNSLNQVFVFYKYGRRIEMNRELICEIERRDSRVEYAI